MYLVWLSERLAYMGKHFESGPNTASPFVDIKSNYPIFSSATAERSSLHAILVESGSLADGELVSMSVAAYFLCEKGGSSAPCGVCRACRLIASGAHPDITVLDGTELSKSGNIPVAVIREQRVKALVPPTDGERKGFILKNCHLLEEASQNALLKQIEEPPPWVFYILLTENSRALLPTVLSRLFKVTVNSTSGAVSDRAVKLVDMLSRGEKYAAAVLLAEAEREREVYRELLSDVRRVAAQRYDFDLAETVYRCLEAVRYNVGLPLVSAVLISGAKYEDKGMYPEFK